MGEAEEEREKKVSGMVKGISRDLLLLQRFSNGRSNFLRKRGREEESNNNVEGEVVEEEDGGGPELSLGLSMNGKFGVDPKKSNRRVKKTSEFDKMRRSSSVSFFVPAVAAAAAEEKQARVFPNVSYAPLTRTCSLPADTWKEENEEKEEKEEELKKRRELQSLRRLEAKKRRLEKLKFSRAGKEYRVDSEENSCEENGSNIIDSVGPDSVSSYANGNSIGIPSSQGSIGSQGSGSSGLSEFDSQPTQVKQNNEAGGKTPSNMMFYQALQSRQKNSKSIPLPTKESAIFGSGGAAAAAVKGEKEETTTNCRVNKAMFDMPCVSTIGNGPNGRKVDGFLYRYRRGEEVSIVCVCHGSFFSPAEFVKHAGGNDVEHPLKHIVVNSSSPLF